ncbi:MAG: isoprenylcysteine carboxylmethyltransferase family protein [Anaerolineaceae bacterium]|jgi:protein-S-isoprenylcysteine O-methyltransferase Ste14|nr:isoprenylcysteine carboxylmethyltransferase family protein [Anaerolineaceae bacterium]
MNEGQSTTTSRRKKVIGIFLLALLLLIAVEVGLVWVLRTWWSNGLGWGNQVAGLLMFLGGIFLVGWTIYIQYTLGKGTPYPNVATQRLITTGPYAYTRNPMTLGAFFLYLGIAIGLGSGVVSLLILVIFVALLTFIYQHETRELTERFGTDYLEYRKRTPFLIPRCPRS